MTMTITRDREYLVKGEYHKNLDKNWRYYPVYLEKMKLVEKFLKAHAAGKKILDLGCGEGVLVEKYKSRGYDILGSDLNYESANVRKLDMTNTGFASGSFDIVLCLDVIEHLPYADQEKALDEIKRLLKPGGLAVMTIPNLAHFSSRLSFLFLGRLLRTSEAERHVGDRPIWEYLKMLKKRGFAIIKRKGIFPTYPLCSLLTYFFPSKVVWWHKTLNKFFAVPGWCFLNFIICRKSSYE